jgi:hypothetical protein
VTRVRSRADAWSLAGTRTVPRPSFALPVTVNTGTFLAGPGRTIPRGRQATAGGGPALQIPAAARILSACLASPPPRIYDSDEAGPLFPRAGARAEAWP